MALLVTILSCVCHKPRYMWQNSWISEYLSKNCLIRVCLSWICLIWVCLIWICLSWFLEFLSRACRFFILKLSFTNVLWIVCIIYVCGVLEKSYMPHFRNIGTLPWFFKNRGVKMFTPINFKVTCWVSFST